jgi:hypothetical protein
LKGAYDLTALLARDLWFALIQLRKDTFKDIGAADGMYNGLVDIYSKVQLRRTNAAYEN